MVSPIDRSLHPAFDGTAEIGGGPGHDGKGPVFGMKGQESKAGRKKRKGIFRPEDRLEADEKRSGSLCIRTGLVPCPDGPQQGRADGNMALERQLFPLKSVNLEVKIVFREGSFAPILEVHSIVCHA